MAVMIVDLKTLLTVLISKGIAKYEAVGKQIPVPPGYTIRIVGKVNSTSVAFGVMCHLVVDTDHALSLKSLVDNKFVAEDDDVVQQTYPIPRIMYEYGAMVPVRDNTTLILTNKTANIVYVNYSYADVTIPQEMYDGIIRTYLDAILKGVDEWSGSAVGAGVELR